MHELQSTVPQLQHVQRHRVRDVLGTASAFLGGGGGLDVACRDTASAAEVQVFSLSQVSLGNQIHGARPLWPFSPPTWSIWSLTSVGCQAFSLPLPFLQRVL